MIKVLVVDDSPTVRALLVHILNSDTTTEVVGVARDGESAVAAAMQQKPDVITMDFQMPVMNGLDATRKIMETNPIPIVIVSGVIDPKETVASFRAMEAGAVAVLPRPVGIGHPDHESMAKELIQTVKLMSGIKLVRRWARRFEVNGSPKEQVNEVCLIPSSVTKIKIVAIGASTGGPVVIQRILSELPRDFPVPILIVQHMATGFLDGFVEWLNQTSHLPVCVATHGQSLLCGYVYIAPSDFQMKVNGENRVQLTKDNIENGLRPAVSYLFRSVAQVFGENALGILLSGMGKDGAQELRLIKESGGITIAQDQDSSVVYGMPGEAARLDGASFILSSNNIASALVNLVNKRGEEE